MTDFTGQLFFTTDEPGASSRVVYVNSDGTGQTILTTAVVTAYPREVGVDTAAGLYFTLSTNSINDHAYLLRGSLGSSAAPTIVVDFADNIVVDSIEVDAINRRIYVSHQDGSATPNGNITGIRVFSYDVAGALTDLGFLTTAVTDNRPNESGFFVLDPHDFALDSSTGQLFYTEEIFGLVNGLFRIDLANPNVATQVVSQAQFPDSGSAGIIIDVEVDTSTDLLYFDTASQHPSPQATYHASENAVWYISQNASNGTATRLTLNGMPGGSLPYFGDMTLDQSTRQLYVVSEESEVGINANNDVIYVFQLDAAGTSATLIRTLTLSPQFSQDFGNFGGLTFTELVELHGLSGTATAVVEQGAAVALLAGAPTITDDGGYLRSATVQITGGGFVSGESSVDDDHLGYGAGMQQSGTIAGTSITVTWNQSTGTLTLTGNDTIAHYATVLAGISFQSSGDNPTNSGLNTTRTITWTLDDGTPNVPAASQNSGTTTITITGVDDALAVADTPSVDADTTTAIDVVANDTDPDGGAKAVVEINGGAVSIGIPVTLASGATVTLNADGTIGYDPNGQFDDLVSLATSLATGASNFSAVDSFSYTLNGGSSTTVSVTVFGVDEPGDELLGTALGNEVTGTTGNDVIRGFESSDILAGGDGNDVLWGNDGNDSLFGGANDDRLYGGNGDDSLQGGDGNDVLIGNLGDDALSGGLGDDTYYVDSAGDTVTENLNEGYDTVRSQIGYTLGDNLEELFIGGAARDGWGNGLDNTIHGSESSNTLVGLGGADVLRGNGGRDQLDGGAGEDLIDGGVGKDVLIGGADRDVFQFRDGDMGGSRPLADLITDFSQADSEKIHLGLVDADTGTGGDQAFAFVGTAAFTGTAGELRYQVMLGDTWISADVDGDGNADWFIGLTGVHALTANDFVL